MEATVKKIGTKQYGFLKNPEGGPDIFFHLGGQQVGVGETRAMPGRGQKIVVLSLQERRRGQQSPQAMRWKLA